VHSSSMALDRVYDTVQQRTFERFYGRNVYQRARKLKAEQLADPDVDLIGTYRWALISVRFLSPAWALELDRMAAHTALFRSMTLIIALTTIVQLVHKQWPAGAARAVLALRSIKIYQNLRWRNIQTVYEYYIALACTLESNHCCRWTVHCREDGGREPGGIVVPLNVRLLGV
jgi:hypothetical protein